MSIKTRSGLMPTQTEVPYLVTTSEVEEYLQGKVNVALKDQGHMNIQVLTIQPGKKFAPLMIFFPESASNSGRPQGGNNELSVFKGENASKIQLDQRLYKAISPYVFNKEDENAFFSADWRRRVGVAANMSQTLKAYRKPHLQKFQNGKIKLIGVMLDPVRIFHDMLSAENYEDAKRERFCVFIEKIEKIKNANVTYTVTREKADGHSGRNKDLQDILSTELSRKMR